MHHEDGDRVLSFNLQTPQLQEGLRYRKVVIFGIANKPALFHNWVQDDGTTAGLVEYADGSVEVVPLASIQFQDTDWFFNDVVHAVHQTGGSENEQKD